MQPPKDEEFVPAADAPPSNFADDPMTLLWQNAEDRETGAEAVEAIRARRKSLGAKGKERGPWHMPHS